jgi:hypothetical protein
MQTIVKHSRTVALLAAFAGIAPAFISSARAATPAAETAAVKPDMKKLAQHLNEHPHKYPATRAELLAACDGLTDFSAGEKRWYADHLPEGTYKSAADVLKAIGSK